MTKPNAPLRIVHVVRDQIMAGSQRVALSILGAPELQSSEKILLCGDSTGDNRHFLAAAEANGIQVIQIPGFSRPVHPRDLLLFVSFVRILRRVRPDTLHTHSTKPFVLAGLAGFFCRVPYRFYTIHGLSFRLDTPSPAHRLARSVERLSARLYTELVSVNQVYVRQFGRMQSKGRVRVIPNGVKPPRRHTSIPRQPYAPFNILFAGRLAYQKNPEFMLAVAKELVHVRGEQNIRFVYVGDGPLRERLRASIAESGLTGFVTMHGWVDDLEPFYATADVIFMPSRYEACGLVLLEAGHHGCPAIGTRVEGIPEVVEPGVNGGLFQPENVAAASNMIKRLMNEPDTYRALSDGARQTARTRSEEAMVAHYINLYAEHSERALHD